MYGSSAVVIALDAKLWIDQQIFRWLTHRERRVPCDPLVCLVMGHKDSDRCQDTDSEKVRQAPSCQNRGHDPAALDSPLML